jgi:6-phosphogluconate dehydrogenase
VLERESERMKLGMVGLGRMGANMTRRLRGGGIEVVGFDQNPGALELLVEECSMLPATSLPALVRELSPPRVVWLMLPAGEITAAAIAELADLLRPGDILIDGGNANYKESMQRGAALALKEIDFVDAGVSGGIWGLENGYGLMLGGSSSALARLAPVIRTLAPEPDRGWVHAGPTGSGHFVKMIHNGIEYGMMQSYAEGLALMRGRAEWGLDLAAITESWRHGSVIQSWLLDLTADFLARDQDLSSIEPFVQDSGEGRWTAIEAIEQGVAAPAITAALIARFTSQEGQDYSARLLAMMRQAFGGHATLPAGRK